MSTKYVLPWLALFARVAYSQTASENATFIPITDGDATVTDALPSMNVTLNWATLDSDQVVVVALAMNYSTIVLEDLAAVSTVDCSDTSVSVTFNNTTEFTNAQTHWDPIVGNTVLITNHMGDCDLEFERGFFLADPESMVFNQDTLTVVMSAEKTNISTTALETTIDFENVPIEFLPKRGINLDQSGLTIAYQYNITEPKQVFQNDNKTLTIDITHAKVNSSATFSGHIKFSLLDFTLTEMTFDVVKTLYTDLGMSFVATEPYTYTMAYNPAVMEYDLVQIPGIISLGPALKFGIGALFHAEAAMEVTADLSASVMSASAHVDVINPSKSSESGWVPVFSATANVTEKAMVSFAPSMDISAELSISLFGGLFDLSSGVKAGSKFPVEFAVSVAEAGTGTVSADGATASDSASSSPANATCENGVVGLDADVAFAFELSAFATQWVPTYTLYNYTHDIMSECYTWF